jgi:Zinc carboxypeptidase
MLPSAPPPRARSFRALRRDLAVAGRDCHRPADAGWALGLALALVLAAAVMPAQQMVTETRDPAQAQDEDFAKSVKDWTTQPYFTSPLVDHLPKVSGVPSPKDVLGYHVGAPAKLTYYADILKYYRALAAAVPGRVRIETIGKSDEDRELVVVWISSDENIKNLTMNRDSLARIADPRRSSPAEIRQLIATTKPQYHLMGGLHSGETGPSEMLMELAYRLATESSPLIRQIRDNVYVSVTPVADPDGRDRNVDWFYRNRELGLSAPGAGGRGGAAQAGGGAQAGGAETGGEPPAAGGGGGGGRGGVPGVPYWGKYVFHDNNRDINLSQVSMRAITDWYFTAHPPIMHDLHESQPLLYTYSGAAPQNPNLDPILFAELPFFSNFELSQMTKWGMPGVYTHAFMDGWSPGYLGSVAYNHNGMMRMYETQAGNDVAAPPAPASATPLAAGPAAATAPAASDSAGRGQAANATPPEGGAGRGGRGRGGAGGGRQGAPAAEGEQGRGAGSTVAAGRGATAAGPPTGRGGGQPREWYRGLPIPPGALANWSRRNNANYMQTGVLSGLQLTAMFPNLVVENFYQKTRNSIESGKTEAPFAFVIPVQRDGTRVAELVNILRAQGIEVGRATGEIKISDGTFPAGSYVIKRDQPYGRLAKNLLERQSYPDPNLRTYDDSGWTMGLAMLADVREIKDKAILDTPTTLVLKATAEGKVTGNGSAGLAIAHYGSNNMVAFRYKLRNVPMKITDRATTIDGVDVPAGSFVVAPPADLAAVRSAVQQLGLTAVALSTLPTVPMHDGDLPRVAIYSSWTGTQEIGWVRFTFDRFGVPFDLIYKERVRKGNLRADYDVIVMPTQTLTRQSVFQPAAAKAVPYMKDAKYKFLGMYGESPDITGGMGGEGVDAFAKFLDAGGTLVAMGTAVRFPTDMGLARTVDATSATSNNFYAPRPLVNAEVLRLDHPVFYGYTDKTMPIKYIQGQPLITVGEPDRGTVLARYVGGDAAVLSGLMRGADEIRERPVAVDVPGGFTGKGRVILFANNPIYRWQNHGEFNMVFNTLLNWNDMQESGKPKPATETTSSQR